MHATNFRINHLYFSPNRRLSLFSKKAFKNNVWAFSVLFLFLLAPTHSFTQSNDYDTVHKVKKGENLFRISKKYGTTVENIQELNKLGSSEKIFINQELLIKKGTDPSQNENSRLYRDPGEAYRTYYSWENEGAMGSDKGNGKFASYLRQGATNKGSVRGAASPNSSWDAYSRENDLSYQRNSLVDYTYAHGYDHYNWTDLESNVVGNTDPEILDIIDKLDEQRASVHYDRYGRRVRTTQEITTRSNHARMTYRGSHGGFSSSFRRSQGAINNPYYKERVRDLLAGTIIYYRVKKGDSLLSIALAHGSSTQELIEENELKDYDLLVGSTLKVVKRK